MIWDFKVTLEGDEFCNEILLFMVSEFKIQKEDAIKRINQRWCNVDFKNENDIRYHEDEEFWAYDIYYGSDSQWWNKPKNLTPLPLKNDNE